jgi:hypothetical protein
LAGFSCFSIVSRIRLQDSKMKFPLLWVIFILIAMTLSPLPAPVRAEEQAGDQNAGLSDATKGGIGCLVTSGAMISAALAAGPSELLMVAAGGLLVPSRTSALLMGLTGALLGATCSVGIAATPAVLWFTEQAGVVLDSLRGSGSAMVAGTAHEPTAAHAVAGERSEGTLGLRIAQSSSPSISLQSSP